PACRRCLARHHRRSVVDGLAVGAFVGKQPGPRPVDVDEVSVGRIDAFAHEGNMVMLRDKGGIDRLAMAIGQPGGNGTGGSVESGCGQAFHPRQWSRSGTSCKSRTPASSGAADAWCTTMRHPVGPLWKML